MADYQYVTETGLIVPDTSAVLEEVRDEFRVALGADLIVTPSTPQGALIVAETVARTNVIENNAAVANQINPNLAGGVFLDAIWALTGGQRLAATPSVLTDVALTGLPGVVIPAGSQISTTDGSVFESTSGVVLDGTGFAVARFQSVELGPIAVAPGSLQIVSAILGWDAATTATAANLGRNEESDIAARLRRRNTLSLQNVALPEAIVSALYAVTGVRSVAFRENTTSASIVIEGVTLVPHSIFACVDGGADEGIGSVSWALLQNKSLGADWNGSTTVLVYDEISGQQYPVKFSRPTTIDIQARFSVRSPSGALGDILSVVQAAVLAYAAGEIDGEVGFAVGENVSAFELAGAVTRQIPGLYVQKCEISLLSPVSWSTDEIDISITQVARIFAGNISVTIL